jgi:hypothetical protein
MKKRQAQIEADNNTKKELKQKINEYQQEVQNLDHEISLKSQKKN